MSIHYYAGTERIATRIGEEVQGYTEGDPITAEQSPQIYTLQIEHFNIAMEYIGVNNYYIGNNTVDPDCEDGESCASMYYYHSDHLGSSTFLTDESGTPRQYLLYLPFGVTERCVSKIVIRNHNLVKEPSKALRGF